MLINLRNALMTGKRLPYDAEVEYLENTVVNYANYETIAFPYIDTGIPAADDVGVRITYEYRYLAANRGAMVCGSFVASGSGYFGVYNYGIYNYKMWGGATKMPTQIHVGEVLTTSLNFMESGAYEDVLNGATINSGSLSGSPTFNPGSIWAFAINKGNYSTYELARLRIYGFKITKGSTLVRDYIPVRKGTVGYLYDRVSGKLFGNAGTGDFVLGQDVVPVEYIESAGWEYIDTGVIPDNTTGIEVVHSICLDNGTDNIVFGMRQDSGNTRYWSDVDWGVNDSLGWGFNTYSGNNERFMLTASDVGRIITNSLNFMNDRAGKIDGVTYDSSLRNKTLATMSRSIYLFGANNQGVVGVRGKFKVYSAKISKGQTLANKFLSVRVGTEGAMMDVLTRRIYRNAGTGAFTYGNDLKYPIPAE